LLNASVDVERLTRVLPSALSTKPSATVRFHPRGTSQAHAVRAVTATSFAARTERPSAARRPAQAHPVGAAGQTSERRHHGHPRLPLAVLVGVILVSVATTFPRSPLGATGGPTGDPATRLVAGVAGVEKASQADNSGGDQAGGDDAAGDQGSVDGATAGTVGPAPAAGDTNQVLGGQAVGGAPSSDHGVTDPDALALLSEPVGEAIPADEAGPYFEDGTLVKPTLVNTSVEDGAALLKTYKVRSGDTLTGIAHRFGVSMMTLWWANHLHGKDELKIGQVLSIPPVNGLVITVKAGDTLESIASLYHVDADEVYGMNKLSDRVLVIGQTLILPGATGKQIQEPRHTQRPSAPRTTSSAPVRTPPRYSGGSMRWPVIGGNNYISQYFHYGHYAIDIAADYGSTVVAAASGTVIFAGWKNNGGGYQVWIAHGSGLYTTYNHMSAVTVGRGQSVGRGQQVGRVGQTGNATGPHLHFEVWRGPVWNGGTRVNPLLYL
jgi:murein DD-endopeptidase MepM/ murein hydrolase activator NlpD